MADRNKALEDFKIGLSYKAIAEKYNVSESTVKSWAARYWNTDKKIIAQRKKSKKLQPKNNDGCNQNKKSRKKRTVGGQLGNINALGHGPPIGNQNARTHGAYSSVYWDTLNSDELSMIENMEIGEEEQLEEQLKLYTVREHRILKAIQKIRTLESKTGDVEVCSSIGFTFENNEKDYINAEGLYETKKSTKPIPTFSSKHLEKTEFAILRMEKELTSVQRNKTRTIQALADIRRINGDNSNDWLDEFISAVEEVDDEETK